MDDVDFDLRNKGVKRWRTTALDRREWVSVMREGEARRKWLW